MTGAQLTIENQYGSNWPSPNVQGVHKALLNAEVFWTNGKEPKTQDWTNNGTKEERENGKQDREKDDGQHEE